MNYESAYLAKLEGIITRLGGVVPAMTIPTSFERRSLELLDAISTASPIVSTAEPSSPAVGQRWREVDGSGLLLGRWQWSGSLWVEDAAPRRIFAHRFLNFGALSLTASNTPGNAQTWVFLPLELNRSVLLSKFWFYAFTVSGGWTVQLRPMDYVTGLGAAIGSPLPVSAANTDISGSLSHVFTKTNPNLGLFLSCVLSTSGTLTPDEFGVEYKLVR